METMIVVYKIIGSADKAQLFTFSSQHLVPEPGEIKWRQKEPDSKQIKRCGLHVVGS